MFFVFYFFLNDTATTEIYTYLHTLSLHDALPISHLGVVILLDALCAPGLRVEHHVSDSLGEAECDQVEHLPLVADLHRLGEEDDFHLGLVVLIPRRPSLLYSASTLDRKSTRLNSSH